MKKLLFLLFLFSSFGFSMERETNIAFFTIWKSGSHLIQKCIFKIMNNHYEEYLLNNPSIKKMDYSHLWSNNGYRHGKHYYCSHFNSDIEKMRYFMANAPHVKFIFNVRDPRDVCLSICPYVDKMPKESGFLPILNMGYSSWKLLSLDEKLMLVIRKIRNNQQYYNALTLLKEYPNILLVRFENLVGSKGGGSDALQKLEILKIAKFLGIKLSDKSVDKISRNLFGDTKTFHKGQIGKYKEVFQEHHYEAFEETFADLIEPLSKWYDFSR